MIISPKREYFWLKYSLKIVPSVFAVMGTVTGILGNGYSTYEKLNGIVECPEIISFILSSIALPLAAAVIALSVSDPHKMIVAVMGTKIAIMLAGLIFGINTNIPLSLFHVRYQSIRFPKQDRSQQAYTQPLPQQNLHQ